MESKSNIIKTILDRLQEFVIAGIRYMIMNALYKISDFVFSSFPRLAAIFAILIFILILRGDIAL